MKKLSDIEEEYQSFESKITTVHNLDEFNAYINYIFSEIEENIYALQKDYIDNKRSKFFASIRNMFPMFFEEEEVLFYDRDNSYLDEILLTNLIYQNFFETLVLYSSENNVSSMIKLVDFLVLYYGRNIEYIEGKRDSLEYELKGYGCINYRDEDSFLAVLEFFEKKISELSSNNVEKIKKI
jgi:hypothetical protein